jgi:squalene synthase HpnC
MASYTAQQVNDAYAACQQMVRGHYENFPVASLILPRRLRQPISAIYAFARSADDFADEGDWDAATRLTHLKRFDAQLEAIAYGETVDAPIFIALADTIDRHALPMQSFHDLITAFSQDVTKKRYASLREVWQYCRYSANPVGRLLLHLIKANTPENLERSDAICSALQLINFLQDISQDLEENDRIYLPQDLMANYGVDEQQLRERRASEGLRRLIEHLTQEARQKMHFGQPLGHALGGRFGFQLRIMINGGLRVLALLERQNNKDVYSRPRLSNLDWARIVWQGI